MRFKFQYLFVVLLSIVPNSAHAIPFTFEARSLAMGGVSVATADLATAAWANPAMLTNQRLGDEFSLLVGAGLMLTDDDDLISDIDDFQSANDRRLAAAGTPDEAQAAIDMQSIVSGLDGKLIAPEVSGVAALGIAFDSFAMAVSIRGDIIAGGTITNLSSNAAEVVSDQFNILNIEGVSVTEFGVSFAKDFKVSNKKVSIGFKPKVVDLQVFTLRDSIINASAGFDNINKEDSQINLGTFATFDMGFAVELTESYRLGLILRNLINDSFGVNGQTLNFDTEARIGIAYHNQYLTVAVDYDLLENKPLLANPVFGALKSRLIAIGAEFNTFDIAQLRVGVSKNLSSGVSDGANDATITAGIGFWLGFNLDVSAIFRSNSIGGFLQTGFRF